MDASFHENDIEDGDCDGTEAAHRHHRRNRHWKI
jgi:hypothetical protein